MTAGLWDYVDVDQAGEMLGLHPESVRRLLRQKRIPGGVKVANKWFIHPRQLEAFAATYDNRTGGKEWSPPQDVPGRSRVVAVEWLGADERLPRAAVVREVEWSTPGGGVYWTRVRRFYAPRLALYMRLAEAGRRAGFEQAMVFRAPGMISGNDE